MSVLYLVTLALDKSSGLAQHVLDQELQNLPVKAQVVNILGFMDYTHKLSVAIAQLCHYMALAAI